MAEIINFKAFKGELLSEKSEEIIEKGRKIIGAHSEDAQKAILRAVLEDVVNYQRLREIFTRFIRFGDRKDLLRERKADPEGVKEVTRINRRMLKIELLKLIRKKYLSLLSNEIQEIFWDVVNELELDERQLFQNLKNLNMEDESNG